MIHFLEHFSFVWLVHSRNGRSWLWLSGKNCMLITRDSTTANKTLHCLADAKNRCFAAVSAISRPYPRTGMSNSEWPGNTGSPATHYVGCTPPGSLATCCTIQLPPTHHAPNTGSCCSVASLCRCAIPRRPPMCIDACSAQPLPLAAWWSISTTLYQHGHCMGSLASLSPLATDSYEFQWNLDQVHARLFQTHSMELCRSDPHSTNLPDKMR